MTSWVSASAIVKMRSPFAMSRIWLSGVITRPIAPLKISSPSCEYSFSCGKSPVGIWSMIAPVLVSRTSTTLPTVEETSISLPSGDSAMWSERYSVTGVRQMISPVTRSIAIASPRLGRDA